MKLTTFDVITKARAIHGFKYKYEKMVYIKSSMKITVTCEDHGDFRIKASNHINMGQGCAKCCSEKRAKVQSSNTAIFIEKAVALHGNEDYDYSLVDYKTSRKRVEILCNKCNTVFLMVANEHLKGRGCPECCEHGGFKVDLPATLYYLEVANMAYKIGITNRSVQERFSAKDLKKIRIIKEWYYEDGAEALAQEQKILREFKYAKYTGDAILENGNTELFSFDVLGLAF